MSGRLKQIQDSIENHSAGYKFKYHIAERLPLVLGISLGILSFFFLLLLSEGGDGHAARAYWLAAKGYVESGKIYNYFPPYMYAPITIVVFIPYAFLQFEVVFLIHSLSSIVASAGLAIITIRYIRNHSRVLTTIDRGLIFMFFICSSLSIPAYMQAQINTHIALMIGIGFVALERDEQVANGVVFAGAALFKVIPAIYAIWQFHRQKYRATLASIVVGVSGLVFGVLLFGIETTRRYIFDVLLVRRNSEKLVGGVSPESAIVTVKHPIGYLLPWADNTLLTIIAILIITPVVAYVFQTDSTESSTQTRILGMLVIIIASLSITPSYFYYIIYSMFPLISAIYLIDEWITKVLLSIGASLTLTIFTADDLAAVITALSIPDAIGSPVVDIAYALMSVMSLPLIGITFICGGSVYFCYNMREQNSH